MKKYIYSFLLLSVTIIFFSCGSKHPGKSSSVSEVSSEGSGSSQTHDGESSPNRNHALCGMPWGTPENTFVDISPKWMDAHRSNDSFVYLAGIEVNENSFQPVFDGKRHLIALSLSFKPFIIHPENDYAPEEKDMIIKNVVGYNKKIEKLIDYLSSIYGTPEKDNFDATSTDPYFSQSEEILCEWNTENTHVELTAKYDGNSSTMGCNMLLKVNSNKRK